MVWRKDSTVISDLVTKSLSFQNTSYLGIQLRISTTYEYFERFKRIIYLYLLYTSSDKGFLNYVIFLDPLVDNEMVLFNI